MSECFDIGMSGDCCIECPVFLRGECPEPQEFLEGCLSQEELDLLWDLYKLPKKSPTQVLDELQRAEPVDDPVLTDLPRTWTVCGNCGANLITRGGVVMCSRCHRPPEE